MSSVATLFGVMELMDMPESGLLVDWVLPKQNIGIEIEAEHKSGVRFPASLYYWDEKGDGSLQNGREYVLKAPLKGNDLATAIAEFFGSAQLQRSLTSGTHIHLDMREKTTDLGVVQAMAAIICCIEPAIFGMFGEGREWSGYTNKLETLPQHALGAVFDDESPAEQFARNFQPSGREYKYYGFNMLPLGRFGSVEFRYFPTATNPEELIEWIQFCQTVKAAGVNIGSLAAFKQHVQHDGAWDQFLYTYFAQWADRMKEFLPYVEVRRRYKAARTASRTGPVAIKIAPKRKDAPPSVKSKKFRKFYAIKVKDMNGKFRLAHSKEEVQALRPLQFIGQRQDLYALTENGCYYESDVLYQTMGPRGILPLFYVRGVGTADVARWVERSLVPAFKQAADGWMQSPTGVAAEHTQRMVAALRDYIAKLDAYYADEDRDSGAPDTPTSQPPPTSLRDDAYDVTAHTWTLPADSVRPDTTNEENE